MAEPELDTKSMPVDSMPIAAGRPSRKGPTPVPPSDVSTVVVDRLAAALGIPATGIEPDSRLTHLENASSLRLIGAVTAIENQLAVEIDLDELVHVRTVADFVELVEAVVRSSKAEFTS